VEHHRQRGQTLQHARSPEAATPLTQTSSPTPIGGSRLSPSLQQQRINSVGPTGIPNTAEYGLALAKFGPMYGHDGTLPGFQSFMGHDPITKNTLIVLANLTASPKGELPANEIAKIIIPAL
jgi:D-alanyl-D-alanine carboxypeptidase